MCGYEAIYNYSQLIGQTCCFHLDLNSIIFFYFAFLKKMNQFCKTPSHFMHAVAREHQVEIKAKWKYESAA